MPRPVSLSAEQLASLRAEADQRRLRGESLRPWLVSMAEAHQVGLATLYRQIEPEVRTRKRRSDAGALRAMEAEALSDIAAMVVQHDYPAELALATVNTLRAETCSTCGGRIQRAVCTGCGDAAALGLEPYSVSVATINRHLDKLGLSRREADQDKRIHRRWEAPYAGYLWQMDSTVAAGWYIDTDGSVAPFDSVRLTKNKVMTVGGKPRIWLITVKDDYSRTTWPTITYGNDVTCWIEALERAMREGSFGPAGVWPAFGVPERLYTDNDSVVKSAEWRNYLDGLGIEHDKHRPSNKVWCNAMATGKVEREGGVIMKGFEVASKLRRFASIEEINHYLGQYALHRNNKKRSYLGNQAPFERWIATARVRVLPEADVLRLKAMRPVECKVYNDLTIRLEGQFYQLPHRPPFSEINRANKVRVLYSRADLSKITLVLDGELHEIDARAAAPDVAGDVKSAPKPEAVKIREVLLERDLEKYKPVAHRVFERANEMDRREYPIRPVAAPHPLSAASLPVRMVRRGDVIDRLQREHLIARPPTAEERASLDALLAGRSEIPESEVTDFIQARRAPADASSTPILRLHTA